MVLSCSLRLSITFHPNLAVYILSKETGMMSSPVNVLNGSRLFRLSKLLSTLDPLSNKLPVPS